MGENKLLSPVEWLVYRYIRKKTYQGGEDRWTTQKELVDAINADPNIEVKLTYNEADYNHCRGLWTIINGINQSGRVPKIIVTKNYKYKLGNAAEVRDYFAKQRKDALKKLARLRTLERRASMNGQGTILDSEGKVIDEESTARRYFESLVPEMAEAMKEEARRTRKGGNDGEPENDCEKRD